MRAVNLYGQAVHALLEDNHAHIPGLRYLKGALQKWKTDWCHAGELHMVGADGLFLLGSNVIATDMREKLNYSYVAVAVVVTIPRPAVPWPAQSLKHSGLSLHHKIILGQ